MFRSIKALAILAALLFTCSAYFACSAHRLALASTRSVEIPIRLTRGAAVQISFRLAEAVPREIAIQYSKKAVPNLDEELLSLSGNAALLSESTVLMRTDLPTHQ